MNRRIDNSAVMSQALSRGWKFSKSKHVCPAAPIIRWSEFGQLNRRGQVRLYSRRPGGPATKHGVVGKEQKGRENRESGDIKAPVLSRRPPLPRSHRTIVPATLLDPVFALLGVWRTAHNATNSGPTCRCAEATTVRYYNMGRYSSQQAYSDERMRIVTYEQATSTRPDDTVSPDGGGELPAATKSCAPAAAPANYATAVKCDTPSLFVGNLHPRISDLHLEKLFKPYGELLRIHIVTGSPPTETSKPRAAQKQPPKHFSLSQKPRGYAFVEYKTVESAKWAISRLNGRQLLGKSLAVRPSHRKQNESGAKNPTSDRKEYAALESRIEAVKKAIELKKKSI